MADENDELVSSIIDEDFAAFEEELLFDSRYDLPHSFSGPHGSTKFPFLLISSHIILVVSNLTS